MIGSDESEKSTLKNEVLLELKRQSLKEDIVKELRPRGFKVSLSRFAQHPAFLLLISFVLTGGIGAWLTSRWQSREWDRQQSRIFRTKIVDQKFAIIDDLIKMVGRDNSEARAVMDAMRNPYGSQTGDPLQDAQMRWEEGQRSWRVMSAETGQKIGVYFRNTEVQTLFGNALQHRVTINHIMSDLALPTPTGPRTRLPAEASDRINLELVNESADIQKLTARMLDEIKWDLTSDSTNPLP